MLSGTALSCGVWCVFSCVDFVVVGCGVFFVFKFPKAFPGKC